jgi:hypothetical protein
MMLWANDFRAIFWVAVVPGVLSVALLAFGVKEPQTHTGDKRVNPIRRANLARLGPAYWGVVAVGTAFALARFSEAFLILRVQQEGLPLSGAAGAGNDERSLRRHGLSVRQARGQLQP